MNEDLRTELLHMKDADCTTRQRLVDNGELFDNRFDYHPEMKKVHKKNNKRMREIIKQYGWPGFSLVGIDGCEAAGLIIQHAILEPELQKSCLKLLEDAVKENEAHPWMYALLLDRVLVKEGNLQIYGSQQLLDKDGNLVPYPIEDESKVDERRKAVGLEPLAKRTFEIQKEQDDALKKKSS